MPTIYLDQHVLVNTRQISAMAAAVWILALLVAAAAANEDWANCTPCKCSWVSGRKNADCKRSPSTTLTAVPSNLSEEIRSVDFTDQPFHELTKNVFTNNNLGDLQKIKLIGCRLSLIDKLAFAKMELLIELDMSKNDINKLDPDVFRDNKRLRIVILNDNKLEVLNDSLFANLTFLQRVELDGNRIATVGKFTFSNTPALQYIMLNSNLLKYMDVSIIQNIQKLSSLGLHNNSWVCDCHLKTFRDYTVKEKLFTLPTECASPERLKGRSWSDLTSEDFACRPRIILPPNSSTSIEAELENVTLSCKVKGNPRPDVSWVFKNNIIDSNPRRSGGQHYSQSTSLLEDDTYWYNLTIVRVHYHDGGDYKCAAKNPGGIQERNITLKVNYLPPPPGGGSPGDTWTLVLFIILGLVVLALLLTVLLWCCLCRRRHPRHTKGNSSSPNGDISLDCTGAEMEKSLITAVNPVEKPPRQYPPSVASGVTEVSEVNRTLLDNDSMFAAGDDESRSFDFVEPTPRKPINHLEVDSIRSDHRPYPPDLLAFGARGFQVSPAGSSASTVADGSRLAPVLGPISPVHSPMFDAGLYRTLPYSRSHSPFTSPLGGPAVVPRSANKGYVTMPRRTRVPSWSSAPPAAEPVYDNLGLRTTAQGSSMLSLNKTMPAGGEPRSPVDVDTRRLSAASLPCVPEARKVPPRPPPKPKKSVTSGPLFEDEGEDGTEV